MATQRADDLAGARILIVEDDRRVRETIRWALEEEGFLVETAADGRRALERATLSRPELVVLDMMLPVLDGAAVADGLRTAYSDPPPILLLTADGRPEQKARRVGAYAHLAKPFEVDDLVAAVRRGLDGRLGDPVPQA
jgi:two-component system response regulator MprA